MSDVEVPFDNAGDQAVLLLDAAQSLDLPLGIVRTTTGAFVAPQEVVEKAFGKKAAKDAPEAGPKPAEPVQEDPEPEQAPAKKAAAKKAPAKKAPAKKAAAKKTTKAQE